jgi:serine/threonine protein phosphatase PrpC
MSAELAAKSPQAHAITRWVGADSGDVLEPETIAIVRHALPETDGLLLLCTDGLWNYFPTPEAMAGVVREASRDGAEALAIARQLVDLANGRGGHDNITAAVLRHHAPEPEGPAITASED